MGSRIFWRRTLCGIILTLLSASGAHALVKFNEGRDQLFVGASLSVGYDSNIFATNGGDGDVLSTYGVNLEYARRAGLITVNGNAAWSLGSFADNADSDFSNPSLGLEFTKNTGRTTGSLTLGASRQSQADPNVNLRTVSWNYNAGFNWKYPVIERYSLAGTLGYGLLDYIDNSAGLVDLTTYSASTDLFYAYNSKRDLVTGYRLRQSETSTGGVTNDHSVTAGVSGKIFSKLNGSVRAGYQVRNESQTGDSFGSTTASASTTWTVSKRFTLTGTLSKDFSTTGTESTVDSLRFNIDAQYVLSARWSLYSGVGVGYSDFLNGVDGGRSDKFFTSSAGVNYSLNDHFKASLTYSYFQNWSNRDNSAFDRHSLTLNMSTRW